ncbi:MYOME protein, partial [Amia calva]|nr:MYOME protein [Amia calva]
MHNAVRQLRGQLDQAQAQIRTLQAQQRGVATLTEGVVKATVTDGPSEGSAQPVGSSDQLMVRLGQSLRCKEQVIQDCISVLRKLCVGGAVGKDSDAQALLIDKLQARLKDRELAVESAVDSQLSELRQRDQELESLRRANREKDRDLSRLNTVLHSNLDTIAELRAELSRLTQALEERGRAAEREREAWRLRDSLHRSLLKDRDALVGSLQGALSTSQKDVQALSQSVMGLGVEGSGAEGQLAGRLQEKEALLERLLREQKEKSEARWQEVEQLSAVLDDTMATIQVPSDGQAVSSVWAQLGEARRQLRERESEGREREREWRSEREEREREDRVLRESLEKRDKLIQQVLSDSEERERLLSDLQHSLLTLQEPRTALKHTL